MESVDREDSLTLEILQNIEQKHDISQRAMADQLGIALGMANTCLKRCVRKGLIKIQQAPANRYLYYLTPSGFAEKSRLTAEYLSISFDFYRKAGESCEVIYNQCQSQSLNKVVMVGATDLAEIALIRSSGYSLDIIGVLDIFGTAPARFHGIPVFKQLLDLPEHVIYLVTDINQPMKTIEYLLDNVERDQILIPDILGLENMLADTEIN